MQQGCLSAHPTISLLVKWFWAAETEMRADEDAHLCKALHQLCCRKRTGADESSARPRASHRSAFPQVSKELCTFLNRAFEGEVLRIIGFLTSRSCPFALKRSCDRTGTVLPFSEFRLIKTPHYCQPGGSRHYSSTHN